MSQILEEDLNETNNEFQNDSHRLYNQTFPSNQIKEETKKTIIYSKSKTSNSAQTTIENVKTLSKNNSYVTNTNNNFCLTVNNSILFKNLKYLEEDNTKLREALSELKSEVKEKDQAINESQKIIRKVNDEYSQMVKEFKKLEEERNILQEENEKNKKMYENISKRYNNEEKMKKQNEQLKNELIKMKEIVNNLKGNFNNVANDYNKREKDIKDKEIIIKDLKIEGSKIINMLQDRELLIQAYSKKVYELNGIIKQKDEQLKMMINFSKELNDENKMNVKELTKQAIKTLKIFYSTMNNKEGPTQVNLIEITKGEKDEIIDKNNNLSELILGQNSVNSEIKNKCSFELNEATKNELYLPEKGINYINKEFLIDNNFKTCLLKTELFGSIIREFELFYFFSKIFSKLNEDVFKLDWSLPSNNKKDDIQKKKDIGGTVERLKNIKKMYNRIYNDLINYKKENISLKTKLKDVNLYINKLKNEFYDKIKKFKEKIKFFNEHKGYINDVEKENKLDNKEASLEEKNREEISNLHLEIDKIKLLNHNLGLEIKEKNEIINRLKSENEQLSNKLSSLKRNPIVEKNNSFSSKKSNNKNNKKENKNLLRKSILNDAYNDDLSINSNNNDIKFSTNKASNSSNENFFDYSLFDSESKNSKNSLKFSTNPTSNRIMNMNKNNIKNIFKNINELSNNDNDINENDISNIYIKSTNYSNFLNLKIQNQEYFSYFMDNNLEDLKNCKLRNTADLLERDLFNNIFSLINDFKMEMKKEKYTDLINKYLQTPKIVHQFINEIEQIKSNLNIIKKKFEESNSDKRIRQLINIIESIEKFLQYLHNHLNNTNIELKSFHPYLKIIFDLVFKIVYHSPFSSQTNIEDINPLKIGKESFQNLSVSDDIIEDDYNSNRNYRTIQKNDIVMIRKINMNKINLKNKRDNNKLNRNTLEEIDNTIKTKESLFPNIQELKQFFEINKNIFSSSELIKYRSVYEELPISKLLSVFKGICDNLKKTVYNSKNDYESDISDLEESNIFSESKNTQDNENNIYHIVNEKIFGLKRFELNYKVFMELLKNYLVCFELIVNEIEIEIQNKNRQKQIELGEEINILYNIFEDAVYFKMDKLDDDIIFNRKMALRLLLNHKEYLSIIYDI